MTQSYLLENTMARESRKVAVIGAGNVGATCAFVLAERKIGEYCTY